MQAVGSAIAPGSPVQEPPNFIEAQNKYQDGREAFSCGQLTACSRVPSKEPSARRFVEDGLHDEDCFSKEEIVLRA